MVGTGRVVDRHRDTSLPSRALRVRHDPVASRPIPARGRDARGVARSQPEGSPGREVPDPDAPPPRGSSRARHRVF